MKLSIVIITHDKLPWLRGVLGTLEAVDFPPAEFEVIVVDDGSTDGTAAFLATYAPSYRLRVERRQQGGRAAARNTGCRLARGAWILTLDDDCLMPADALKRIWRASRRHPSSILLMPISHVAVEHVPAVLARIEAGERDLFDELDALAPDDRDYAFEELFRRMLRTDLGRIAVPWAAAQGSSTAFPAAVFRTVEGYDEGFEAYGMEDFEFALRAHRAGYGFVAVPAVRYAHLDHGHTRRALFKESTDSVRYFYRKHGGAPEVGLFIKFLCGALSFQDFNNRVAAAAGKPPIDDLDLRFSPYGMISYRDRQREDETAGTGGRREGPDSEHREALAPAQSVAPITYSAGQRVKGRYLLSKLARDLDDGHGGLGTLPRAEDLEVQRVLVLAPHMDDEVIGCGGLIHRWAAAGARVAVAFLTNGAPARRRHPDLEGLRRTRRQESRRALQILGAAASIYLDFPDGELDRFVDDPRPLLKLLATERPEVLLVPADTEYHPDHRAAFRWARRAVAALDQPPRILCYEVCGNCRPNRVLELDDSTWAAKMRAMEVYRTQLRDLDYRRIMRFVAETRGRAAAFPSGVIRAETFRLEAAEGALS